MSDNSNIGDLVKHIEGDSSLTPAQKRVLIKRVRVFPEDDEIAEAQAELDQESAKAAADVLRWKVAQSDVRLIRVLAELEVARKERDEARAKHWVASGYDDAGQFLGAWVTVPDGPKPRRVEQVRKSWDNPLAFPRVELLVEGRSWYLLDQVQVIDKPSGG